MWPDKVTLEAANSHFTFVYCELFWNVVWNHMNAMLTFTLFTCMFYEQCMHGKAKEAFKKAGTKKIEDTKFSLSNAAADKLWLSAFHYDSIIQNLIFLWCFFFNTGLQCVRHTKDLQGGDIKLCMNSDGQKYLKHC